jgi:septal ring factor EnvC (AmiA/AmiB activator)
MAAPKLSKDELRAQVAKLEGSNATLKAKSRDMNRAFKAANSRIADLETELAELREQAAAAQPVTKPVKEAKAPRAARASRKASIDPGDAVPPGVAVEEPQPLDEEAQTARDALEEHLSGR